MIRNKFTVDFRNKLSSLAMSCDSAAAIEGAKMTGFERENIKSYIREVVDFIDKRIVK